MISMFFGLVALMNPLSFFICSIISPERKPLLCVFAVRISTAAEERQNGRTHFLTDLSKIQFELLHTAEISH